MRILIVDDEDAVRLALQALLGAGTDEVRVAEHAPKALALLETWSPDLVISDMNMPAMSGLQLLEEIRHRELGGLFVLMTAYGDERTAVGALRNGAFDYVPKPFDNEEIRAIVARARELLSLRSENARLREELASEYAGMVGGAPAMREVYRLIERAAPTDVTVLISGESGTGKELVARALHEKSRRRGGPFIALNCAAIPAELVESELFGHVRGAFTGADRDRVGAFQAASGGTLFLDEIGDLALSAQAKLLRVLEERALSRVGSHTMIPIDVRIVSATNRPLERLVADGGFREDLLYRLAILQLHLPPLRERREDIIPLVVHFIARTAKQHSLPSRPLAEDARRALLAHDWPGNVRELRNCVERALVLAEGEEITVRDLPPAVSGSRGVLRPGEAAAASLTFSDARERVILNFERDFLSAALERHAGNVSATARAVGLHRQSLQKLLRKLGLSGVSGDG